MRLRQAEAGTAVEEMCRKLGVAEATFYRWKKQSAEMNGVDPRDQGNFRTRCLRGRL